MGTVATEKTFHIPRRYKAAVYDKPGTISTKIEKLETPEPGPGDILVRLCVMCSLLLPVSYADSCAISERTQAYAVSIWLLWSTLGEDVS